MIRLVHAELRKLTSIRSSAILLAFTLLASGLLGFAVALAPHQHGVAQGLFPLRGSAEWFDDIYSAMAIAQDFALVFGVLIVSGEWRHKTVTPTFLTTPRRGRVIAAKFLASAIAGLCVAVVAAIASLILAGALVADGYGSVSVMCDQFGRAFPGILLAAVLFGVYGLGVGSLLKNQVLSLVVSLGVTAVVEPIIIGVWPGVGRWLPSAAAHALQPVTSSGAFGTISNPIAAWQGGLVLLAYGVVLASIGAATTMRTDIT